MRQLEKSIYNCKHTNSEQCRGRFSCHPIPGYGSARPKFLVLGINPALRKGIWRFYDKTQKELQEKYLEECLKYGYGSLLRELSREVPDFDVFENVYLSDVVRCPTIKGLPSWEMMMQCRTAYLEEMIRLLKPETIIALGDATANQLHYVEKHGIRVIPARHPSRSADVPGIAKEIKQKLGFIDVTPETPKNEIGPKQRILSNVRAGGMKVSNNPFEQALNLWLSRQDDERPGVGSQTYNYFTLTLRRYVENLVQKAGFSGLTVKASVGVGKWAEIPWVGIRDEEITDNFHEGEFVVYVFAPKFGKLYLTIIMGVENKSLNEIDREVSLLRKKIRMPVGFSVGIDGKLSPDETLNSKPYRYKSGILYSKRYDLREMRDFPVDSDLKAALDAYQNYARTRSGR